MKTTKLSYVLFSLAMIAALVMAAVPMAPAHAMSADSPAQGTSLSSSSGHAGMAGAVVCRSVHVWRHGHWVTVRVCHRVK